MSRADTFARVESEIWSAFTTFAEDEGISLEFEDDFLPWYVCFRTGWLSARGIEIRHYPLPEEY